MYDLACSSSVIATRPVMAAGAIPAQVGINQPCLPARSPPEVSEQACEARLEGVVILPVREVGDEVLANLDPQILPAVRVEALPIPDRLEVNQADRAELASLLPALCFPRVTNLGSHPLAARAVWRAVWKRSAFAKKPPPNLLGRGRRL